ncbi:hypothetical protein BSZ21_02300 [Bradyrhizobium canariense]|nr:hypothetical protein BSZ21_02300 [Bradyrhizobium canariense]
MIVCCHHASAQSGASGQYGPDPKLPEPQRGLLPTMKIANPAPWGEKQPRAPQGYFVTAIATDLKIPRQTLVLPNGDILVAEGRGGADPTLTPKDFIAGIIKARGVTHAPSGIRLTDKDGDGVYQEKTVFAENLNAPYGMALVGNRLYVANQDALVRFDYTQGQTRASGPPVGEHGSWNRPSPAGYKVVFVPFSDGRPSGPPVDFLDGFIGEDGMTRGRPVGVTVDSRGALLVADDLSNTIWRVTAAHQ